MRKKSLLLIGLIAIAAAAGTTYRWMTPEAGNGNSGELVLYGNVEIREARLAFNGSEHLEAVLVEEGDNVVAGQPLARLHTERLAIALRRAQAEVDALRAEARAAELSRERVEALAARKLASREEADESEGKALAAAARVAAAEAALAEHRQALEDATLRSPSNGIIRERIAEPGDFVSPQTPVLTLSLVDPVWIRTYVPETYLGKVVPGAPVHIITDSFPEKNYPGWVGSISPTAEFTPKHVETPELRTRLVYQARIFACNPDMELRLGMPATVVIDVGTEATPRSSGRPCEPAGTTVQ